VIRLIKVTGYSLSPFFEAGDFVLLARIPCLLNHLKAGDIVVFRQADYGTLIKRVERFSPDRRQIYVIGERPDSTDSRTFGPVPRSDLIGKVIWHFKGPR
jgi:hypothetical protein